MAAEKYTKTNAMRILDKFKIQYRANYYDCNMFIDGIHIADQLGQPYGQSFKTLVCSGKSAAYYVFVIPVNKELDLKAAAKAVKEKNIEMLHVKDLKNVTGYVRGGCTAIGMKKAFPTVIDVSCAGYNEIIISGGAIGVQLFIAPKDFIKATGAVSEHITID